MRSTQERQAHPRKKTERRSPPKPPAARHELALLTLVLLTWMAFSNSFSGGFILDNRGMVADPRVHAATAENLKLIWQHTFWWFVGESGLYRPLTTLSFLFNYSILGNRDHPEGYHWINFFLHAVNVLLLYALAYRWLRKVWPAMFAAGLWAVHPILTESVTNIVGRADLLAALGILGGLFAYLESAESEGRTRWLWLACVMGFTTIGAFSKESAVLIPAVIALYAWIFWTDARQRRAVPWGVLATLPPIAAMLYQRSVVLAASLPSQFPFTDNPIAGATFWTGRLTALKVIALDLGRIAWPATLSSDYSYSQIPLAIGSAEDWIAWVVVLLAVIGIAGLFRWNRIAFFLGCFAALNLAPTSNLLFPIGTIMAERFLYLPALGLLVCLVMGVYAIAERIGRPAAAPAMLGLLIVMCGIRTWARNADWSNDLAMAEATVRASPNSFKSHEILGRVLFTLDDADSNLDRVIQEADNSRAILDSLPDTLTAPSPWGFAGRLYVEKGDRAQRGAPSGPLTQAGAQAYRKAVEALTRFLMIEGVQLKSYEKVAAAANKPADSVRAIVTKRDLEAWILVSSAHLQLGEIDQAAAAAAQARELDPLSAQVYSALADIGVAQGRLDDVAATLLTGMFLTSDPGLQHAIVEFYQRAMDPRSCALIPGPNGPKINPQCAVVHQHICAAAEETVRTLRSAGTKETAQARRETFVQDYGCPAAPIDNMLR